MRPENKGTTRWTSHLKSTPTFEIQGMYTLHRWLHGSGARNKKKHKESFTRTVLVVSFLNSTYSDVPLSEALN